MRTQTQVNKRFRGAVSSGAFAEAEQLLAECRQEVLAAWNAATSASERQAIAADVTALLEWARVTTLSARAHAQTKLVLLDRQSAYVRGVRNNERFNLDA
jgi:hypothetical protein